MKAAKWTIFLMALTASLIPLSDAQEKATTGESAAGIIENVLQSAGADAAVQKFKELRSTPPGRYAFKENEFNSLGYRLIRQRRFAEAVRVFEMAVELFPKSANVYDSLGEGYLYLGDRDKAEQVLKTALRMDNTEKAFVEQLAGALQGIEINDWRIRSETREVFGYKPGEPTGLRGPYLGQERRESTDKIVITILYNNISVTDSIIADHGFSCLIESGNHSCLFDAGRIADKFMMNVSQLGVNCSRINQVFVSHIHDDHMGGVFDILAKCNNPTLYLPFSYPQLINEPHSDRADSDFNALLERLKPLVSEIIQKKESVKIGDEFYSTGMIENKTYEQALIVPTSKGLIIIAGCSHPGILEIVKRAKELMKQDVYFVMGGFHLVSADSTRVKTIAQELRKLTKYIGPCHCTGEKAQGIFKDIFKEDYIDVQAGLKLTLGDGKLIRLKSNHAQQGSLSRFNPYQSPTGNQGDLQLALLEMDGRRYR